MKMNYENTEKTNSTRNILLEQLRQILTKQNIVVKNKDASKYDEH